MLAKLYGILDPSILICLCQMACLVYSFSFERVSSSNSDYLGLWVYISIEDIETHAQYSIMCIRKGPKVWISFNKLKVSSNESYNRNLQMIGIQLIYSQTKETIHSFKAFPCTCGKKQTCGKDSTPSIVLPQPRMLLRLVFGKQIPEVGQFPHNFFFQQLTHKIFNFISVYTHHRGLICHRCMIKQWQFEGKVGLDIKKNVTESILSY